MLTDVNRCPAQCSHRLDKARKQLHTPHLSSWAAQIASMQLVRASNGSRRFTNSSEARGALVEHSWSALCAFGAFLGLADCLWSTLEALAAREALVAGSVARGPLVESWSALVAFWGLADCS